MSMLNLDLNWIFGTSQDDDMTGTKGSETTDIFFGFCGDDKFVGCLLYTSPSPRDY